ncbi:MAG: tRNA dihydrouridine(20/20a) synthase DusA, partial [Azospirillaceae bacterium]
MPATTDTLGDLHRLSIAPMMDWTDRHCRYFHRLLSRRAVLYTEMVTSAAVVHGDAKRLIGFDPAEQPVVLQLGGSESAEMAEAARIAEGFGYAEVNINVGCPSDRVQSGRFGACLMAEPRTVAACVAAMRRAISIPVTVKCRIGIDDQDTERALDDLVEAVAGEGCAHVIVHARKAWLKGLSPRENRSVPPLDYDRVYRLKARRPDLFVTINGGIPDLDAAEAHLTRVDGVMLGRAAYETPWLLAEADSRIHGTGADPAGDRFAVVETMAEYADRQRAERGTPLNAVSRHMLGLFHGLPGARAWRRHLAER